MRIKLRAFKSVMLALAIFSFVLATTISKGEPVEPFGLKTHLQTGGPAEWHFVVSGDSRNCGDVVMPAIAKAAAQHQANFYWHLGDFRAIYEYDEDMLPKGRTMTIYDYQSGAWNDFLKHQISPFTMPVFLAMGNHESIPPKTRSEYIAQFADWLNSPVLKQQRLQDDPNDHLLKTYYHWVQDGIDFITMDNATTDQFDDNQMAWVTKVLQSDEKDAGVHTIVVGMHEALPDSIAFVHSMSDYPTGEATGRRVYARLLALQKTGKKVYVLASHSHYFMDGIFNTEYWRTHGGVLPGWIIGTAGAVRYPLPPNSNQAKTAKTNVYGYVLATVNPAGEPPGTIKFDFHEFQESDIPDTVVSRLGSDLVHQ